MIPLNQTVMLVKSGGLDSWGVPTEGNRISLRCNRREQTKLTKNKDGEEVVTVATYLFKGFVDVTYNDSLEWTHDSGEVRSELPIAIKVLRDLSGKAQFTRVEV